jgi:hypothetical protein
MQKEKRWLFKAMYPAKTSRHNLFLNCQTASQAIIINL